MRLRPLGWAGAELEHAGRTLVIDLVEDASPLYSDEKFPAASRLEEAVAALVTHLHTDHADPVAIRKALAPVNGPVVELLHLQPPSPFNAAMLPEEAAVAAHILGARIAVPLHYGTLNKAPIYVETPRAVERFEQRARELGIAPLVVPYGEWFEPSVAPVR